MSSLATETSTANAKAKMFEDEARDARYIPYSQGVRLLNMFG